MATYDSIHTGNQVDQATNKVLANKDKGSNSTPIYLDANGAAQPISKDVKPVEDSAKLIESGGVYTELQTKYNKVDISNDDQLGDSSVLISSEGAIKTYADNAFSNKQDNLTIGEGLSINDGLLSVNTAEYMTENDISEKRQHFSSELPYGTNSSIVEKMSKDKHSTFDLSKFTVVGSPTITADGIASGFSSSNYIRTPFNDYTKPWEIHLRKYFPLTIPSGSDALFNFFGKNDYHNKAGIYPSGSKFRLELAINTLEDGNNEQTLRTGYILPLDNEYDIIYGWDGTEYYIKYKLSSDENYTKYSTTIQSSDPIKPSNKATSTVANRVLSIGSIDYNHILVGSIDLKQFSITVDGVEVFSGNKTGVDKLKPDNYTIMPATNSSIIVNEGIASNFSSTSTYITTSLNLKPVKTVRIECTCTPETIGSPSRTIWRLTSGSYFFDTYKNSASPSKFACESSAPSTSTVYYSDSYAITQTGDKYKLITLFDIEKNTIRRTIYKNDAIWWASATQAITRMNIKTEFDWSNITLKLGASHSYWIGSIDLNEFKIYVDDKLAYQPTLYVPYTLTKDGKKIVDNYYKDRNQSAYDTTSYTPYYSLNENSTVNYVVGGTTPPTVTDGIVSGISTTGWVQILYYPTSNVTDMEIEFDAIPANLVTSDYQIIFGQSNTNRRTIQFEISKNSFWLGVAEVTSAWVAGGAGYYDFEDGVAYHFKIIVKNNSTIVVVNNTVFNVHALTSGVLWSEPMRIGVDVTTHPWQGTFDLNSLRIKIDGKLVYQPIIPPNYTMATVKSSDLVGVSTNGAYMYRQYANQTIEQYGTCTETTSVTFEKPFANTDYALSVPYSAKTTTGFTPDLASGVTRSWKAKGKVFI